MIKNSRFHTLPITWLTWFFVAEILFIVWGLHFQWQQSNARQQAQAVYNQQTERWQQTQQSLFEVAEDWQLELLYNPNNYHETLGVNIHKTLSLVEWAALLEGVQKRFWVSATDVKWQRQGTLWQGDITWMLQRPSTLKPYQNLIPIESKADWGQGAQLLSTLHGDQASALIKIDQAEYWFKEGSWLPMLQATLSQIDQEFILLRSVRGETRSLMLAQPMYLNDGKGL